MEDSVPSPTYGSPEQPMNEGEEDYVASPSYSDATPEGEPEKEDDVYSPNYGSPEQSSNERGEGGVREDDVPSPDYGQLANIKEKEQEDDVPSPDYGQATNGSGEEEQDDDVRSPDYEPPMNIAEEEQEDDVPSPDYGQSTNGAGEGGIKEEDDVPSPDYETSQPAAEENPDLEKDEDAPSPKHRSPAHVEAGAGAAFLDSAAQEADDEEDNLIADIFGQSDDEEEFTGFELSKADKRRREDEDDDVPSKRRKRAGSDSDSDPGVIDPLVRRSAGSGSEGEGTDDERVGHPGAQSGLSDFDLMMERKKAQRRRRRRKGEAITGADDRVVKIIHDMRLAAEDDRRLNERKQAATKKLKLLNAAVCEMQKFDQQMTFIEEGGLSAIAEWLTPLPDQSLPHIKVREALLKWLCSIPDLGHQQLKASNIGRAVMFLYRHPRESSSNRKLAGKLINDWSRVIFGLVANYKSMSRDEREERDYMQMKQQKQRRQSTDPVDEAERGVSSGGLLGDSGQTVNPGSKDFVGRARVPMPSNKDYIVRPKWNVDHDPNVKGKKELNRFEKQRLKAKQAKQMAKTRRAAKISLVGTKMPL